MTGKKVIILVAAALAALVIFLVIPSPDKNDSPVNGVPAAEEPAGESGDPVSGADEKRPWDIMPRLFSGMDDTGEYRRPPEERDSPGALTREMMEVIGRFAATENLPPELLLPIGASKDVIDRHMGRIREILQYDALARYGTASIEQRRKLCELKKEFFEDKARLIEDYREINASDEDRKSSEEALGLLRDRIRKCEEELRRL
ncbi:MAG: hypothetical protein JW838_09690 [Spirochaetes bacterium]|nr:hypothetical protein [Spirochaetota bacterium]